MNAEENANEKSELPPESWYERLSGVSQITMLYGAGGTLLFLCAAGALSLQGYPNLAQFFIYVMIGCMGAFFLAVIGYIALICFGAMKFTLRGLLASTLLLGLSAALATSASYVLFVLGLVIGDLLVLYWVYRFFKASFEQDRRDGMV